MIVLFQSNNQAVIGNSFIDLFKRVVVFAFMNKHFGTASDWFRFQGVSGLFDIGTFIFPDKEDRNTLEGIDKWEEEVLNEILVMG